MTTHGAAGVSDGCLESDTHAAIGFIGLGNMGREMAGRLVRAGRTVVVHDRRPEAVAELTGTGAEGEGSVQRVADRCELVLVSLPSPAAVREVALGERGLVRGARIRTFVDLSTTGPDVAREVAAALGSRGIAMLDAPVSGGVQGACSGRLSMMTSGSPGLLEHCRPVLERLGERIFHVGPEPGQGQLMKVINNLLAATALAITSEVMALGVKSELDPDVMLDVLNASSGHNTATRDKFPASVLTGTFDYGFGLELMCKDLALCIDQAKSNNVPTLIGSAVQQLWNVVEAHSENGSDFTAIAQWVESMANVEIRSRTRGAEGTGDRSGGPSQDGAAIAELAASDEGA